MNRPIIVYIGDGSSGGFVTDTTERDAFSYFVKNYCSCETLIYKNEANFNDDLIRLKKLIKINSLILIIVEQERYSSRHIEIILKVRTEFSQTLPIVVIPQPQREKIFPEEAQDPLVFAYYHFDKKLINLVKNLSARWTPKFNWFGANSLEEQYLLLEQLQKAYKKNYFADNEAGLLCAVDSNHQTVAEAIRIRLFPPELIKVEFDETIVETPTSFAAIAINVYDNELERFRSIDTKRRSEFMIKLLSERRENNVSLGSLVKGFAIDVVTSETFITSGFGMHSTAGKCLVSRLEFVGYLLKNHTDQRLDNATIWDRIVSGLIFMKVPGFETPILFFQGGSRQTDKENVKLAGEIIRSQRKFIPVTAEGEIA